MKKKGKHKMKRRWKGLFLVFVFTTLTITLCGCTGDKAGGDDSSEITIGIPQDLDDSLDPHIASSTGSAGTREVLFNVFEGLVKPDSDGSLIPAVASDKSVSEDGKTYTFTLRENVKFHDGSTVTTEDVIYSIERCADAGSGEPLVPAFSNIESITAPDEHTIVIQLAEADTEFLAYMTAAIIPKTNTDPDKNPIGTGPYQYVSRSPQEEVILKRFDEYWGKKANIENITLKIVANADTIATNLNGGAIDMYARVTSAQAAELTDDFEVYEGTMNLVQALYLNNQAAPFDDVRIRQTLSYAVDKHAVIDMVSEGKGVAIGSSIFPAFGKYYTGELATYYEKDIEKAKALLAEAGYADGFSFKITVPSNYQQHIDTAQVLAEQLKEIGVEAEIELVEWDSWLSDVYVGRQYEATVVGVDASNLTARDLLERFYSKASNNFVNFRSDDYDAAFLNAVSTGDDAKQTEYYKECERILTSEAANVYIQDLPEYVALNKKYAGYEFYPLYVQDFSKLYIRSELDSDLAGGE